MAPRDHEDGATNRRTRSKSPFFRPSEKARYTQTPGGTKHRRKESDTEKENKSEILGCSANLINAIVGSGIIGLPYAVKQAGFVAGIGLIVLCAFLTDKSLRLLIETAKHVHVPTYEMVAEAAFGRFGFIFVAVNMFVMAYGAMVSYLMIVKDTFAIAFGVSMDNDPLKRAILFVISIVSMVPLSSKRDVADLAKTSRMNVTFDIIMVGLVLYCAPIKQSWEKFDVSESIVHWNTVFTGLGVLSFAFVCQHSSFIIAGSLANPTRSRWSRVTSGALSVAGTLALICGIGGYIGFGDATDGNILNNLGSSLPANIARGLLGTTMLFVYPMESFVARHVCVVLLFEGKNAHEGDDTSILNRRDRRISLTVALYIISIIPAATFKDVGVVLATVGAIGGSCLSYIGPGMIYLGIHGGRFLELSRKFFGRPNIGSSDETQNLTASSRSTDEVSVTPDSWIVRQFKSVLYFALLMPLWCKIASIGKTYLTGHVTDLALKSPHPIRIGNVRFQSARIRGGATRVVMLGNEDANADNNSGVDEDSAFATNTMLIRADSLPKGFATTRTADGKIVALPRTPRMNKDQLVAPKKPASSKTLDYGSINQSIGAQLVAAKNLEKEIEEEGFVVEDDPQAIPPGVRDFVVAILYVLFGVLAMLAGLFSIFNQS